jgi:putative methyltransferase (TIGR04325 family)
MKKYRIFIKDCIPPIILRCIRRITNKKNFENEYASWDEALAKCSGYEAENILKKVLDATLKVKRGQAIFERDSVLFDEIEYAWPVLSGLMWAAASDDGELNVLDFGGALGSSYFQNRKFFKGLSKICWNVVEQEHFVHAGQAHIQDDTIHFYSSIENCLAQNKPNVALLSGVLPYLPNPYSTLKILMDARVKTIIIDRTPYVNNGVRPSIKIQTVPPIIYTASYPCRFLDERELVFELKKNNYSLVETFTSLDKLDDTATWKGHIFKLDDIE